MSAAEPRPALAGTQSFDDLIAEGAAAEKRGDRADARTLYEQALHAMAGNAAARRASEILRWIARTYIADANLQEADDCLAAALAVAEAQGDEIAACNAINVQAVVQWQLGELDEAERLYLTARTRAIRAGDPKLAAMTAQNLGVVASVRGELEEAKRHYEASLAEYRSLGLAKDVTVALNNLGLLFTQTHDWASAERAFHEATQIAEAMGDTPARILLGVNFAEMWVARQEHASAQHHVKQAMDLAATNGDASAIGQASKLMGVIARETNDFEKADEYFRRAEEIASARKDLLLEAEVAREAGELARRQGRNTLALRHFNRAHRLFTQLRARRDLADVTGRTGRLEEEFLQVARRWGESIEAKDRYTQGHCIRVADVSCAIAKELGFAPQDLFWFRIGALLHDVGKIVIPEDVLNKPGKLTDEEWALMQGHTTAGLEMLQGIEFPWDVIPVVRSHHERFDGRGYPDRLKGEAIPLVARILCVADVYDALTSTRSYKRALSHAQAVDLMRLDAGTMFDPAVFEVFERLAPSWSQRSEVAEVIGADPDVPAEQAPPVDDSLVAPELDDLTRMPLRRSFRVMAQRVLEARITTERSVSLLVIDIDHFKVVNDSFGHLQGDDVLRMVADVLRVQTRPSDFVARYAGDEFVALLPGTTLDDAMRIAERVRTGVEQARCPSREPNGEPVQVSLSIGVATAPSHGDALDSLFAAADGALYRSKRRGRNAVSMANGPGGGRDATLMLETFVGRASERQRLQQLVERASSGRPSVTSVVGNAGVGKSTLLRQLAPELGVRSGSLLIGRCLEADVRPPYAPWCEILDAINAASLAPTRTWRELGRLVPALGSTKSEASAATAAATDSATGTATNAARYALMHEIEEYLTLASAARPLVVVLDDMQWADADTWDVLELLAPRLAGQRLLICLTIRLEDMSPEAVERLGRISRNEHYSEIALGRLSREEMDVWLRSVFGGRAPDPALADMLFAQTEGNPLFAVQTLRMLIDEGRLYLNDAEWVYEPVADAALPTAVRDLLARRLRRLSVETRDILTSAAVIGTRFDADVLLGATSHGEAALFDALDEGVHALVLNTVTALGPSVFEFTHGLLADGLRRGGSPLRLRRVHERVARLLEQQGRSAPAELAGHFDRGGCATEAFKYAILAADRAMRAYAYDSSAMCLGTAERNARSSREKADVGWRLASLDELVGRYERAADRCAELLHAHAEGAEELGLLRPARRMRERLRLMRGAPASDVLTVCEALHGQSQQAGDRSESIALLMMLSQVHTRLGDERAAIETAGEAVAEAARIKDLTLNAEAQMRLGSAVLLAAPADGIVQYRMALDIFKTLDDRRGQLRCHINIGVAFDRAGNHPAAEQSYATAMDVGREVKSVDLTALASLNLGVLLMKTGRFGEARVRFDEALRMYRSINNEPHRLSGLYNLAHLARERGDAGGATELYGACVHVAESLGQLDVHVGALCGVGLAVLKLGQYAQAGEQLAAAHRLLAGRETQWFQGRELLVALDVLLLLSRGEKGAALNFLHASLEDIEMVDQYAAVWLAAECISTLRAEDARADGWHAIAARYLMLAKAQGYLPLQQRLRKPVSAAA